MKGNSLIFLFTFFRHVARTHGVLYDKGCNDQFRPTRNVTLSSSIFHICMRVQRVLTFFWEHWETRPKDQCKIKFKDTLLKDCFEMFTVCFASKVAIGASTKSTKILQKFQMKFFRIRWENGDYFPEKNFLTEKWMSYGFSIYYFYCQCKFFSNSFNWDYISIELWVFFIVTLKFWK
jgi:hypothetical protein